MALPVLGPVLRANIQKSGDMEQGIWSAGMSAGLVHDVPTVAELVDRIVSEAEEIISQRLSGLLS